jgi:hypothetical protein
MSFARFSNFFDVLSNPRKQALFFGLLILIKYIALQTSIDALDEIPTSVSTLFISLYASAAANCFLFFCIVMFSNASRREEWWETKEQPQKPYTERLLSIWMPSLVISLFVLWTGTFILLAIFSSLIHFTGFVMLYFVFLAFKKWKAKTSNI